MKEWSHLQRSSGQQQNLWWWYNGGLLRWLKSLRYNRCCATLIQELLRVCANDWKRVVHVMQSFVSDVREQQRKAQIAEVSCSKAQSFCVALVKWNCSIWSLVMNESRCGRNARSFQKCSPSKVRKLCEVLKSGGHAWDPYKLASLEWDLAFA